MIKKSKSELLLPVGNMKMCLAAIHNGADAIYVGMPNFNARGRTNDFSLDELKEMIDTCHLYGVKVNLAFNVVIFEDELPQVILLLKEVLALNPDAIIVQDIGLVRLIKEMLPEQVIHGSTQMTITNHEAMTLLNDLDIKRFVLGREVSIHEMKAIKDKTDRELEVFVHGALCVAYSGQCFTSESLGGRSANRGQCAQSCRLEYDLLVDGVKKDLGERKYLVSPKDLCGIAQIPELVDIGIASFKVEGRLKTAEYVASAAKNYRQAIDHKLNDTIFSEAEISEAKNEMGLTYSRGFFSGWLNGVDHQQLVDSTYGSHRGIEIGKVDSVSSKYITISTNHVLKNGDGLLITSFHHGRKLENGGHLFYVKKNKNLTDVFFSRDFDLTKIKVGDKVYLNHDSLVEKNLTKSYTDKNFHKKIPLSLKIRAVIGSFLRLTVFDGENELFLESDDFVEKAKARPLTISDLRSELGALSASCFYLDQLSLDSEDDFFIHHKQLKALRRKFTDQLIKLRTQVQVRVINDKPHFKNLTLESTNFDKTFMLNLVFRDIIQVKEFLNFSKNIATFIDVVYLDYEFGKDYLESVQILKDQKFKVGIATTRILKPNEYYNFKVIERAHPDVILIRNLGALEYFKNQNFELRGDFSLNVTNSLTGKYLLSKKLKSICPSYDLNFNQLSSLVKEMGPNSLEVTIHQYMPSFHMEHCVFAAFLSNGSSYRDCGKPCEHHRLELKDQFGHFHQIKADQECRNTMFNATSQSAAKLIPAMKDLGITSFRFESLYERGDELKEKIMSYVKLISTSDFFFDEELFKRLGSLEKYGLTDGLSFSKEYRNRKK